MKKLLVIVLALLTILCLVACDSADAPADTATPGNTEATTKEDVTTDAPDDDEDDEDDDTSKVDIDYRDQLNAILDKDATETLDSFAMNVNMTVGMNFVSDGMNSNNTIPMEFSFVMNKNNAFYADVSSAYLFNTDEPLTVVCVDGVVYCTNPDGEMLKASATEEDIKEMLGLEEMPSFSTDISEMIPEDVWNELPPEAADALKSFKLTDLFKEVKLTSSKNGKRVITCNGLNAEKLPIYSESTSVEGDGETPVTMLGIILDALGSDTTTFSLSFTVNAKDQIIACKTDMKMDISDLMGDVEGGDKYEITFSMNATIDRSPDTSMIVAPANADEYTVVELEDMFDMSGGEEMPDGDIWGFTGTVTNVYDNGTADICYLTFDEDFNEYYETITVNVPDEWMDHLPFIVHIEADIELICHEDGTYTLSWISESSPSSYTDWGTLLSVDTDADGYTYATVLINASGDDGPYIFLVPDDMVEDVSSMVGREVDVEVVDNDDGGYTLIYISLR